MIDAATSLAVGRPQASSYTRLLRAARRPNYLYAAASVGLAAVALALRLYRIDHESLVHDEAYTLIFSRLSLPNVFLIGGAHEHPPLYYLIVHFILQLHDSYLVPRFVSALAGSLSVIVLFALGARLFNRPTGLLAAFLLVISPFHLWYSQNGRAYELAGLLVLLSYLCLFTAMRSSRLPVWIGYVAATTIALYTDYLTVLALLPQALIAFWPWELNASYQPTPAARRKPFRRRLLLAWAAVAICFAPWLATLTLNAEFVARQYWIPPPNPQIFANTVLLFFGLVTPCPYGPCTGTQVAIPFLPGQEVTFALLISAAAVLFTAFALVKRRLIPSVLGLWLILPFVVVLLISTIRSLYLDRIFLDATFPLYLLIGAGIVATVRFSWRVVPLVALSAVMVAASLASLPAVYALSVADSNPDWKTPMRDLGNAYRAGEAVVFFPAAARTIAQAYLPKGWRASREQPIWFRTYLDIPGLQKRLGRSSGLALEDAQLREAVRGESNVWLVTSDWGGLTNTRRWFIGHGFQPLVSEIYYGDTRLELWSRDPPNSLGPVAGFDSKWNLSIGTHLNDRVATEGPQSSISRSFAITPGLAYCVNVEYRAFPQSHPSVRAEVYDRPWRRNGKLLATFPRTQWYDLPATGVWLSQPFGFISPPGSAGGKLVLSNQRGRVEWRRIAVYREARTR